MRASIPKGCDQIFGVLKVSSMVDRYDMLLSPSTVFYGKSDHGRVCVVGVPTNSKLLG